MILRNLETITFIVVLKLRFMKDFVLPHFEKQIVYVHSVSPLQVSILFVQYFINIYLIFLHQNEWFSYFKKKFCRISVSFFLALTKFIKLIFHDLLLWFIFISFDLEICVYLNVWEFINLLEQESCGDLSSIKINYFLANFRLHFYNFFNFN